MIAAALLLSASLWQASTTVGQSLSCYEEKKNTVVCYSPSGTQPFTVYFAPKADYADSLALDLVLISFGTAADLGSTDWAISKGCSEGNPLLPRVESRVAGKIALSAFRGGVAYMLRRHGKSKVANVWRWTGLATDLAISTNNIYCGSRK